MLRYCAIFRPASVSSARPDSTLHSAAPPNAKKSLSLFVYCAGFADSAVKKREECSSQAAGFQCTLPPHGIEFIQHGAQGTVCVATWQGRLIACKSIPLSLEHVIAAELGAVSVPSSKGSGQTNRPNGADWPRNFGPPFGRLVCPLPLGACAWHQLASPGAACLSRGVAKNYFGPTSQRSLFADASHKLDECAH